MDLKTVLVPSVGKEFRLVPRDQLRVKRPCPTATIPSHLKALAIELPTPPTIFDWSKNGALSYPILGNDRVGDCWYAAVCHGAQTFTGNAATECVFDATAVVNRYLKIAGGDNGLSDDDILPEWKNGIVGPGGPRKILDWMTINPSDEATFRLCGWAFGGLAYTAALLDTWLRNPKPGDTWDATGRPDQSAGHAMWLTGVNTRGGFDDQTWGFKPPINLTFKGMQASDPELIVFFSLDQFKADGTCAFTGMSYEQKAQLWSALGGRPVPPSPFGPPAPPIPPTPASGSVTFAVDVQAGSYSLLSAAQKSVITGLLEQIATALPNDRVTVVPAELREHLASKRLNLGQLMQIVVLIIAYVEAGVITPASLQALIAQIAKILGGA